MKCDWAQPWWDVASALDRLCSTSKIRDVNSMHIRNENVEHVRTDSMALVVFMEYHDHLCGVLRIVLRSHS